VFTFDGIDTQIPGVPVTTGEDVEIALKYNPNTKDGWNMIACPNRDYYWKDLIVKKTGPNCRNILEPKRIGDLLAINPYVDKCLWLWENGENTETEILERGKGYWMFALTGNITLVFPNSAPTPEKRSHIQKSPVGGRRPPSPPAKNTGGETDAGGGCFFSTAGR